MSNFLVGKFKSVEVSASIKLGSKTVTNLIDSAAVSLITDTNDKIIHGIFPTGDYGDFTSGTTDAFGLQTNFKTYDCMGGNGYLRQKDLGSL